MSFSVNAPLLTVALAKDAPDNNTIPKEKNARNFNTRLETQMIDKFV